jgi:hypothetical protein
LFPLLEEFLTEAQLEEIRSQIAQTHERVPKDDFADAFWVQKK